MKSSPADDGRWGDTPMIADLVRERFGVPVELARERPLSPVQKRRSAAKGGVRVRGEEQKY